MSRNQRRRQRRRVAREAREFVHDDIAGDAPSLVRHRHRNGKGVDLMGALKQAADQNIMSCKEFCISIGDLENSRLARAQLDTTHLGDVEAVTVLKIVNRFDLIAKDNADSNFASYVLAVVDSHNVLDPYPMGYGTTTSAVSATLTGTLPSSGTNFVNSTQFGYGLLGGASGGTLGGNSLWPWAGVGTEDINYAYVASQLIARNTTPALYRGGTTYAGPVPRGNVDSITGPNHVDPSEWKQYPFLETADGSESVSVVHISDVVETRAQSGSWTFGAPSTGVASDTPKLFFAWNGEKGSEAQTFQVEIVTLFYVFGPLAVGAIAPIRTPGLWACLRSAYSSEEWEPVVSANRGNIERETKKNARSLASTALQFMKENADEILTVAEIGGRVAKMLL